MSFPTGSTTYFFTPLNVTFARILDSDRFIPWAFPESQYTADPVLGGDQVYLDIGGDTTGTLVMVASCSTATDRQTLRLGRGETGLLTNTRGRSDTMTLVRASPVDSDPYTLYLIELTFVLRPS